MRTCIGYSDTQSDPGGCRDTNGMKELAICFHGSNTNTPIHCQEEVKKIAKDLVTHSLLHQLMRETRVCVCSVCIYPLPGLLATWSCGCAFPPALTTYSISVESEKERRERKNERPNAISLCHCTKRCGSQFMPICEPHIYPSCE